MQTRFLSKFDIPNAYVTLKMADYIGVEAESKNCGVCIYFESYALKRVYIGVIGKICPVATFDNIWLIHVLLVL